MLQNDHVEANTATKGNYWNLLSTEEVIITAMVQQILGLHKTLQTPGSTTREWTTREVA